MTMADLVEEISKQPDMSMYYADGLLHIRHHPTKACFRVSEIDDVPWEHYKMIIEGGRLPMCLTHMTRIVGYYSQVENWNKSKIGELAARRKGNYEVKT